MKHANLTKAQRQYVRGIIHNLSLQRWTGSEIADYLNKEKDIQISISSVALIRNTVEKEAEKWYLELKVSSYKYIATYKERLDALFSYQRQLHDIVNTTKKEDTKIRALSTIASIEMDIFNIWKQLPEIDIIGDKTKQLTQAEKEAETETEYAHDESGWV